MRLTCYYRFSHTTHRVEFEFDYESTVWLGQSRGGFLFRLWQERFARLGREHGGLFVDGGDRPHERAPGNAVSWPVLHAVLARATIDYMPDVEGIDWIRAT